MPQNLGRTGPIFINDLVSKFPDQWEGSRQTATNRPWFSTNPSGNRFHSDYQFYTGPIFLSDTTSKLAEQYQGSRQSADHRPWFDRSPGGMRLNADYPFHTGPTFITDQISKFSDQWKGYHPDLPTSSIHRQLGEYQTPDVIQFLLEFEGSHPDEMRLFLGPRIGLPIGNENQVDTPTDRSEFWQGNHPDHGLRAYLAERIPLPLGNENQTFPVLDSPEMWRGQHPDESRIQFSQKPGLQILAEVVAFLNEFAGYHEDAIRLFLGPRIQLPVMGDGQKHDQAPHSVEMSQGVSAVHLPKLRPQTVEPVEILIGAVVSAFSPKDVMIAIPNIQLIGDIKTHIGRG